MKLYGPKWGKWTMPKVNGLSKVDDQREVNGFKVDIRLKVDILLEMLTVRLKVDDPNLEHLPFGILDRPFFVVWTKLWTVHFHPVGHFTFIPTRQKVRRQFCSIFI